MGQLSVYLPPFAPDYSGSCSLLYALNSLIVIHDAQGCTANYTGFDEPRWYGSKKGVFCSGLRKIDVAMGEEERYIRRILDAAKELRPEVIAVVGSPVPLVIGTDFEGLAKEIEERSGVITLGLNTNGLGQYWEGIAKAGIELLDRLLPEDAEDEKIENSVNILGITPLDFTSEQIDRIEEKIRAKGYEILCSFGRESDFEKIRMMSRAKLNLVVNQAGIKLAQWMEQYFGIPYLAGLPIGEAEGYFKALEKSMEEKCSRIMESRGEESRELLIIHDPLIAHAIALQEGNARAATAFRAEEALGNRILVLDTEADLEREVNAGYRKVMADPLILDLIDTDAEKIPFSHFAVSSHFRQGYEPQFR